MTGPGAFGFKVAFAVLGVRCEHQAVAKAI